ncbi:hypothetical protein GCM10023333_23490 [Ferrimonas pelagia]|uniref:Uncharacterized protein n=1 Tax=Ferrimonas pelagia TaxID=1177826 RepID=A0ABP9EZP4_9GAMM
MRNTDLGNNALNPDPISPVAPFIVLQSEQCINACLYNVFVRKVSFKSGNLQPMQILSLFEVCITAVADSGW